MKNRPIFIYALADPSGNIRYVGQSVHPEIRYEQHLKPIATTKKSEWISELLRMGVAPTLIILEKTCKKDANYREKWWITMGRSRGWQLSNMGNPSSANPNFAALFTGQLREEFDQFMIEHDPVVFISRRHIKQTVQALHILLGVVIGLFIGWHTYLFEYNLLSHPLIAIFYGIGCFAVIAHLNFLWAIGEFKKDAKKNLTLSAVAMAQVSVTVVIGLIVS